MCAFSFAFVRTSSYVWYKEFWAWCGDEDGCLQRRNWPLWLQVWTLGNMAGSFQCSGCFFLSHINSTSTHPKDAGTCYLASHSQVKLRCAMWQRHQRARSKGWNWQFWSFVTQFFIALYTSSSKLWHSDRSLCNRHGPRVQGSSGLGIKAFSFDFFEFGNLNTSATGFFFAILHLYSLLAIQSLGEGATQELSTCQLQDCEAHGSDLAKFFAVQPCVRIWRMCSAPGYRL